MDRVEGSLRSNALDVWKWYWKHRLQSFLFGLITMFGTYVVVTLAFAAFVGVWSDEDLTTLFNFLFAAFFIGGILTVVPILGTVVKVFITLRTYLYG